MEERIRDVLCPKWTIELLILLSRESSLNYSDIELRIPSSSDIVTNRLKTLAEVGLIERHERTKRDVEYKITDRGEEVVRLIREINSLIQP